MYFIQPMSGTVHKDQNCSVGTARYKPVRAESTEEEIRGYLLRGVLKACKRCCDL